LFDLVALSTKSQKDKNMYSFKNDYCRTKNLLLYADGARLGSALVAKDSDVTLKDMYTLTDAFFIGGTKTGAFLGEALVLRNVDLKEEYRYLIKQRGGLLAKGRLLGNPY
jgi:threonine aldolase